MIGKLTEEQIDEFLKNNLFGRIGCNDGRKCYVVPTNYVYDGRFIIAHSLMGMKIDIMRKNPDVCLEVDEMKTFTNWKSVIAWGKYQELTDQRDRFSAMALFADRMIHIKMSKTAVTPLITEEIVHGHSPSVFKPIIYRIIVTEKTGRFENQ